MRRSAVVQQCVVVREDVASLGAKVAAASPTAFGMALLTMLSMFCPVDSTGASDANLHSVGLLVVDSTVPGSPADGVLEPGDVLVRVQGEVVSHFLQLEELLDGTVAHTVELQLERGGKPLTVHLPVTDLHDVTPASMLELAGGSVHALSYQQARNNR